ncbi:MAG: alanine--tRNA ligase [Chthoniobacterales bacterium]
MTSSELRNSFLAFFRSKQHSIVSSASLLPDSPNLLFTNAGMNQFVPIFLGKAPCPYTPARAANSQKCIRAGGKHNDLEDVGLDTYHHTFFEMLGNWSFGDYFKKEAIDWAWELLVEIWKFPPERLYATVYQPAPGDPASFDQEAYDLWATHFSQVGLDPKVHIVPGNRKDNFWMMGETGPCGPCSELHVDLTPSGDTRGALVNKGAAECIEIWNLVFIQFNANADGTFVPLQQRHVDTGMGFERLCSIIQGTRGFTEFGNAIISNYETDLFRPIFAALEEMSGLRYGSTLPQPIPERRVETLSPLSKLAYADEVPGDSGAQRRSVLKVLDRASTGTTTQFTAEVELQRVAVTEQEKIDVAFRVIADHVRTLGFAIADGIEPGNNDRNYVLRRILRRAVRYGRTLGFQKPFLYQLAPLLATIMGDAFPEVRTREQEIATVLRCEEESFHKTLEKGLALFEEEAANQKEISGKVAFRLYDEQGFPLDLTELLARERGMGVDHAGFEKLMEEQRTRARAAQKKEIIQISSLTTSVPTIFLGFDQLTTPATLLETMLLPEGRTALIFDRTVCYGEMGGQVGDTGVFETEGKSYSIINTKKQGSLFLHIIQGEPPALSTTGKLTVTPSRRHAIERHHTATHLLHWALHQIVGPTVVQKGSYVGSEKLTFDFNSAPLTPSQLKSVERLMVEEILKNHPVSWEEVPYEEVKKRPEIMQFFGEKYGDRVRVVQIGGEVDCLNRPLSKFATADAVKGATAHSPGVYNLVLEDASTGATQHCAAVVDFPKRSGFSMELCGGTHVRNLGQIGSFRIVSEGAVAAGIRRIEAVAGLAAYELVTQEASTLRTLATTLRAPLHEVEKKVEISLGKISSLEKEVESLHQEIAEGIATSLLQQSITLGTIPTIIATLPAADATRLQAVSTALQKNFEGVLLLAGTNGKTVSLMATVSPNFRKKIAAGKLIQAIAPLIGGKGGGTPEAARGGGTAVEELPKALNHAKEYILIQQS